MSADLLPSLRGARVLTPDDPDWPTRLADLGALAPVSLRVVGSVPPLARAIAIVGTRYADEDALEMAFTLAAGLAAAGRTVISGGAVGIDAAAHRGALEAGGPTLAVLATGFDPPFPPQHAPLFREIAATGGLLSELPDATAPVASTFLARNRLIAALAEAVVVVQAPARSGALSTASLAIKLKREVFSVPYPPWSARGEGCLGLLRRGARICTSARDVLSLPAHQIGTDATPSADPEENTNDFQNLDDQARAVLKALRKRPRHPDELSASLGLRILEVQQRLGQLVLLGLAVARNDGKYVRQ